MGLMNIFICFNNMAAMLRNEVGWFDDEENSADNLSMRLANDATFVRAAFSNRLSIFIQDGAAVIVGLLIGAVLHWRLALVAFATLPVLCISAVAQVFTHSSGFPNITNYFPLQ
jgi:ATP-binding cassette, subfamily B (MDR/TAP), member 1